MIPQELVSRISSLAADLVMVDAGSPPEDWADMQGVAGALAADLDKAGHVVHADAVRVLAGLCGSLAAGDIHDKPSALRKMADILEAIQAGGPGGEGQDDIKQSVAQAELFVKNLSASAAPQEADPALDGEIEEEFIIDIEQRIDQLEELLFSVRPGEDNEETVRGVFREFHTLKGEGAIIGLKAMSDFCHKIEDGIERARHGEMALTSGVLDGLMQLVPVVRFFLHNERRRETTEEYYAPILTSLAEAARAALVIRAPIDETVTVATEEDFFAMADPGAESGTALGEPGTADLAKPVGQAAGGPSAPATEPDAEGAAAEKAAAKAPAEAPVEGEELHAIPVDVRKIDRLMELVSEVSLIGAHLTRREELQRVRGLGDELQDLSRACRSLQDITSGMRMSSVRPLFQRVQRAAFESARALGKRVEVALSGVDTEVDRTVIDRLTAALVHLVRNAVDHGIESPEKRLEAGKPERGRLRLSASRTEADVIIEIADDGRGLDLAAIRRKAVACGLIGERDEIPDEDMRRMIFAPGFSTAESVTGISGRGVGMGVVQESLDQLRGTIEVDSVPGKGINFRLRFPVTLAAIEGLLVRVGENILVFPVNAVRETFNVRPEQVSTVEGRGTVVTIRGVVVPVIFLGLELELEHAAKTPEQGVLVLVEDDGGLAAVLVDRVMETCQVVVRQLEGSLSRIKSLGGAALMPDRSVGLVLEPKELLSRTHIKAGEAFAMAGRRQVSAERQVETVEIGSNQVGMIDFTVKSAAGDGDVREHRFAINAFKAREFVPAAQLTPLPHAPTGFAGMLLLRQATIPVVALSSLLGFVPDSARRREWESIIVICEFSGKTVGFLVSAVNRVSYISWNDIMPPPESGGMIKMEYVVGTIDGAALVRADKDAARHNAAGKEPVVFVLDFERIVQQVLSLYGDISSDLAGVQRRKAKNRVLLAEDSSLIRREVSRALSAAGIEVLEAENGQAALDMINSIYEKSETDQVSIFAYLDLVLSDIEMPKLDGYTLTATIKKHPKLRVLPVLLHSSITNETIIRRAREVEADGFIAKCDPTELARQLKKYL